MDSAARFFDEPVSTVSLQTAFSGEFEGMRMKSVRPNITKVRELWNSEDGYRELTRQFQRLVLEEPDNELSANARAALSRLFDGYRDYADMARAPLPATYQFDALEFYCSAEGYDYVRRVIQDVFRKDDPSDDRLLLATTLVERITIDLYNLRLSEIGDPRYANFEGIVYRWMVLDQEQVAVYRDILTRPDRSKRNFAIPLGFASAAGELDTTKHFAAIQPPPTAPHNIEEQQQKVRVLQKIHIHGIDPALLAAYKQKYPDSVVTSICAMPVARMSPFSEKEILLRGPFYHLIAINEREDEAGRFVEVVVASMNANRDHGSELSSNDGVKALQRAAFLNAVNASKWEVCAAIAAAENSSPLDAAAYERLQTQTLQKLADEFGISAKVDGRLADAQSPEVAVWLGALGAECYPRYYASRRNAWQTALASGRWVDAEAVIKGEYLWGRSEWYNIGRLFDENETIEGDNLTLLHQLVRHAPPTGLMEDVDDDNYQAWRRLLDGASDNGVWKSLKSFDASAMTAEQLAFDLGQYLLAKKLKPQIFNRIPPTIIERLEAKLHGLMMEKAAYFINPATFHFPQLSVLAEMQPPVLWIPVPRMYGINNNGGTSFGPYSPNGLKEGQKWSQ
ncbi:hypothetical protein B0T24DRAFT_599217 [Lasiosphaeria ovina]|uniref:Uncharacterized protein n=1 Tax=Lasiosphaeria ovina TaxID=92902 RepID=A0AAE0JTZ9_9PEZI|nr:hypothetical protein B0T24DRAFT_599217 [Lasiosphaeria ovina]